jgi:cellulose biosynthesis protein BcsQ
VKTIAFVSGKGGVGKTTLAFLLGTALSRAGRRVQYHDLDPNESLKGLLAEHQVLDAPDPEFRIVDTPPRLDTKEVVKVIQTADVICIPTRPTAADRPLTRHTALAVAELRHSEAKALVVFNQVRRGTLSSKEVDALEPGEFALPVASSALSLRECFDRAWKKGWAALDEAAREEFLNFALNLS